MLVQWTEIMRTSSQTPVHRWSYMGRRWTAHVIPCTSYKLAHFCNVLSVREFFLHARRQNIMCITEMHHLNIFIIFIGRKCFTLSCRPDFSFILIHTMTHVVKSITIFQNEAQLFLQNTQPLGEMHMSVHSLIN